jgi:hypothetical protein
MPSTEAHKRAVKKYRDSNLEQCRERERQYSIIYQKKRYTLQVQFLKLGKLYDAVNS